MGIATSVHEAEQWLARRFVRTAKLFEFLRAHRHELFDEAFQTELKVA